MKRGSLPREKQCERARCEAGQGFIGSAREHDRNARAQHDARDLCLGQILELFRQHISGFEIGHDENVGAARAISRSCCRPCGRNSTSGSVTRGREIFSVGAMTSAVPVMTSSPRALVARQARITRCVSAAFSRTLTETVIVSPKPTGQRKCSESET